MRNKGYHIAAILALTIVGIAVTGCGSTTRNDASTSTTESKSAGTESGDAQMNMTQSLVQDVTVHTQVLPYGQTPLDFVATLNEEAGFSMEDLTAEDFTITGKSLYWMAEAPRDFSATITDVSLEGNQLTLTVGDFPEKYFYVQSYAVTCSSHPELSFRSEDVSTVTTPVADDFRHVTADAGEGFEYYWYENTTAKEPLPIVVVFHGFGDTHSIYTYRTSVAWAEADFQIEHPCHVLSVVIDDNSYYMANGRNKVFEAVHEKLTNLVNSGKVDKNRIYIMGNSFGGMSTIEFAEKYPEMPAALLALCAATNYSDTAVKNLEAIKEIPLTLAQAEHDGTIPVSCSQEVYDTLTQMGDTHVTFKMFNDDEMNAAGCDPSNESTVSYHHVEMAVMEDPSFLNWVMEQRKDNQE